MKVVSMHTRETALIEQLNTHDAAYYSRCAPTISDTEYDALSRELKEIEKAAGRILPGSPSLRVGSDLTAGFAKVQHTVKMLSLDNVETLEKTEKFFAASVGEQVTVEAKIDGLSLELRYAGGNLVQAVTRGDGSVGDDVTANAKTIRGIPLTVADTTSFAVRGEVYMRKSTFAALNAEREKAGEDLFANPRNAAAGSFKLQSPAEVAARKLCFVAYWSSLAPELSQTELTVELATLGFPTLAVMSTKEGSEVFYSVATLGDSVGLATAIGRVESLRARADFDIDGAVVKIDDRQRQQELGAGTKAPKWGCAYKFKPEEAVTVLEDIVITVGRTGQVTPIGVVSPVYLGGATITRATLNNQDYIDKLGIDVGDSIIIERAAEVIPAIVGKVLKTGERFYPRDTDKVDNKGVR